MTTANYAQKRKPSFYEKTNTPRKGRPLYPQGVALISDNGRDWYRITAPPRTIRYAKTENGEFYRRRREQDITEGTHKRWASVTAAHVEYFGRTAG